MAYFNLNKILNAYQFSYTPDSKARGQRIFFKIICKSGLEMSVQASVDHYSSPRRTIKAEGYEAFEIGYPNRAVDSLRKYAEDSSNLCDTVYGWVPRSVIMKIIRQNGGIVAVGNPQNQKNIEL